MKATMLTNLWPWTLFGIVAVLLGVQAGCGAETQQTPSQAQERFEFKFTVGPGRLYTPAGQPLPRDEFDSETGIRLFAASGDSVEYKAPLTDEERRKVYAAVLKNDLMTTKDDFTKDADARPLIAGRLRLRLEGRVHEIRYYTEYGDSNPADKEWTRLINVVEVIRGILAEKDRHQSLPPHIGYL